MEETWIEIDFKFEQCDLTPTPASCAQFRPAQIHRHDGAHEEPRRGLQSILERLSQVPAYGCRMPIVKTATLPVWRWELAGL